MICGETLLICPTTQRKYFPNTGLSKFNLNTNCISSYINFAYGDEDLDVVYGDNLSKLRALKQRYDPSNRFNQWFNIH